MRKRIQVGELGLPMLLLLLAGLAGCVRSKGEVLVSTLPSDLRLERQGALLLRVFSDIEGSEECCDGIRDSLSSQLKERGLFSEIRTADGDEAGPVATRLEVKVVKLKKVGTMSRMFLGRHKGQARVVTENRLYSQAGNRELGSFIADGESSLKGVIPELSGTTKQAVKRIVEQIVAVLQQHAGE
ncbi:MAG: hypothetical protein JXO51_10165 [Candidatus Aminicenantes bacterium]|nr:hypothetical protein [Candidatus Aminicenantes bacterium]